MCSVTNPDTFRLWEWYRGVEMLSQIYLNCCALDGSMHMVENCFIVHVVYLAWDTVLDCCFIGCREI